MDLKYALVPVAIVVLFLVVTLGLAYFGAPEKNAIVGNDEFFFNAHLGESGIADSGEKSTAYATADFSGSGVRNAQFTFLWFEESAPRSVYLLDYPMTDADDYPALKESLSTELGAYGFELKSASENDAAEMRNSVLLVPSGAIPKFFTEKDSLKEFLKRGNVLIYAGMPFRYALNRDSSLSVSNYSDVASYTETGIESKLNGSKVFKLDNGTSVKFGGGYLYVIPKTLNQWKEAGKELAHAVVYGEWQKPLGTQEYGAELSGNFSVNKTFFASASEETRGQARIIYMLNTTNGTKYGALDTPGMSKLPGSLQGETSLFPGEEFFYSIYLNESYAQTRKLDLSLLAVKDGEVVDKKPITSANVKDVWVSPSSSYRNTLPAGDYLLRVEDEGGGLHAKSLLHVKDVSAKIASVKGYRYSFLVLLDGKPYSGEKVTAQLDDSKMTKEYTVGEDGMMVVPAEVSSGKHVFHLLAGKQAVDVQYDNTETSLAAFYLQYGVPALLISGALYVLLRRPTKKKYRVTVPGFLDPEPRPVQMSEKEFMGIFDEVQKNYGWKNAPVTSAEIRSGLRRKFAKQGKEMVVTDSNLSDVMEGLEKKNLVKSWREYYAPASWLGGKGIEFHAAKRIMRDKLIERGLEYSDKGGHFEIENGMGKVFYHVHDGNGIVKKILGKAKAGKNVLVFPEEEALARFAESLNSYEEESIRMKMEVEYNGVTLTTLAKLGDAA